MIYLTPWNDNRTRHNVKTQRPYIHIAFSYNCYRAWINSKSNIKIFDEGFFTVEDAKKYVDQYLTDNDHILLTQEQVDKISILI